MQATLGRLTLTILAPPFGHGDGLDANGGYHYHDGGATSVTQRSYSNACRLSTPLRQGCERAPHLYGDEPPSLEEIEEGRLELEGQFVENQGKVLGV